MQAFCVLNLMLSGAGIPGTRVYQGVRQPAPTRRVLCALMLLIDFTSDRLLRLALCMTIRSCCWDFSGPEVAVKNEHVPTENSSALQKWLDSDAAKEGSE